MATAPPITVIKLHEYQDNDEDARPKRPEQTSQHEYSQRWLNYFLKKQREFVVHGEFPEHREAVMFSDPKFHKHLPGKIEPPRVTPTAVKRSGHAELYSETPESTGWFTEERPLQNRHNPSFHPVKQRESQPYDISFMLPDRQGYPSSVIMHQEFEHDELPPDPAKSLRNAYTAANLVHTFMETPGAPYPNFRINRPLLWWEGSAAVGQERRNRKRDFDASARPPPGQQDPRDPDLRPAKRSKFDHPFLIEVCEPGKVRDAAKTWNRFVTKERQFYGMVAEKYEKRMEAVTIDANGNLHPDPQNLDEDEWFWPDNPCWIGHDEKLQFTTSDYIQDSWAWSERQKRAFIRKIALATISTMLTPTNNQFGDVGAPRQYTRDLWSHENFRAYQRTFNKINLAIDEANNHDLINEESWRYNRLQKLLVFAAIKYQLQEIDHIILPTIHRRRLFDRLGELRATLFPSDDLGLRQAEGTAARLDAGLPVIPRLPANPTHANIPAALSHELQLAAQNAVQAQRDDINAVGVPPGKFVLSHNNLRSGHNIYLDGYNVVGIGGWHQAAYVPYSDAIAEYANSWQQFDRALETIRPGHPNERINPQKNFDMFRLRWGMQEFVPAQMSASERNQQELLIRNPDRENQNAIYLSDMPTNEDIYHGDVYEMPPDICTTKHARAPKKRHPADLTPVGYDVRHVQNWWESAVAFCVDEYFVKSGPELTRKTPDEKWTQPTSKLTNIHNPGGFWATASDRELARAEEDLPWQQGLGLEEEAPMDPRHQHTAQEEFNGRHYESYSETEPFDMRDGTIEILDQTAEGRPERHLQRKRLIQRANAISTRFEEWFYDIIADTFVDEKVQYLTEILTLPIYAFEMATDSFMARMGNRGPRVAEFYGLVRRQHDAIRLTKTRPWPNQERLAEAIRPAEQQIGNEVRAFFQAEQQLAEFVLSELLVKCGDFQKRHAERNGLVLAEQQLVVDGIWRGVVEDERQKMQRK